MKKHLLFPFLKASKCLNVLAVGNGGDCITLVSEVLNITPLDAAKFINNNLGLGVNISKNEKYNLNAINMYEQKRLARKQFEKWKKDAFNELCDYWNDLKEKYSANCKKYNSIEQADDFFNSQDVIKYCDQVDKIDYYTDLFIYGNDEDVMYYRKTKGKVVNL